MKLKILVKIIELILGESYSSEVPRADMYLPERALAMCLVYLAGGSACAIFAVIHPVPWVIAVALLGLGLGFSLLLCWRNQMIHVLSDEEFTYTTMLGKTKTYRFSDIERLRRNKDSMTLFVAGDKVHMESMAILSDRLIDLINRELKRIHG